MERRGTFDPPAPSRATESSTNAYGEKKRLKMLGKDRIFFYIYI